ncbi:MAG: 1-acyl-sn-glycerol-3-phosphate acyltransferase [Dermatophilaceae bacterium]
MVSSRSGAVEDLRRRMAYLLKDPQLKEDTPFVAELSRAEHFQEGVRKLASTLGQNHAEVEKQAVRYLREMSAIHNQAVSQWWDKVGTWMLRGFDLVIDEDSLAKLRPLDRDHALVFLISHRSYLDEWVSPKVIARGGITPPFSFAGANLGFFPLGPMARRTGVMHVRRMTRGVPVYKHALRSYIGQLIVNGDNLLWAIEGGRTRTGKLRPPRLGLLRYVIDAAEAVKSHEIYLVPMSYLYDQLPRDEVQTMALEAKGRGKTPENARWFLNYLRGLDTRVGRIYVNFGEPLPLKARLAELRADASHTVVERIAVDASHRLNEATPVTPTSAVCIVMLGQRRAMTLDEVLQTVQPLAEYLRARGWPTAGGANLTDRSTVRRALKDLTDSGVLLSHTGDATVWRIAPDQHLTAANYRNSAIHVLLTRAICELDLVGARQSPDAAYGIWEDALRLRDLLKFEFFFPGRQQFGEQLYGELRILDPQRAPAGRTTDERQTMTAEDAGHFLHRCSPLVSHLVLRPFLDAYAVVAHELLDEPTNRALDEERFLRQCMIVGQQWALQHRIGGMESASLEMFRNALQLAQHRGLVRSAADVSDDPELKARRAALAEEINEYRSRVATIAARVGTPGFELVEPKG